MIQSVKEWLEGLFRPVIRIDDRGRSYIERTPTIDDIAGMQEDAINLGEVAVAGVPTYGPITIVPPNEVWILRGTSVGGSATNSQHQIEIRLPSGVVYYTPILSRSALMPAHTTIIQPLILRTNTQVRSVGNTGGIGANYTYTLIVTKVRI